MFSVSIKPQWQLTGTAVNQQLPRLLELLTMIHETGTLATACRRTGLSYRYAWGMLREGGKLFGAPLVEMSRGRGAHLTPLAEKLMWADKRINARLSPLLDSLASELEVELARAVSDSRPILRLHASHGYAVETLRRHFNRSQIPLDLKYRASFDSVAALSQHRCDMAGFAVPIGEFESAIVSRYRRWLHPHSHRLIHLATRSQGLIVARGNPLAIQSIEDLAVHSRRFVNRELDSSTRALFELLLDKHEVDRHRISGYDSAEFTHAAVAAYVASDMADVGFGMQAAADSFDLSFVPLVQERYFFVCHVDFLRTAVMKRVLETLCSESFRQAVSRHGGYDPSACGAVQSFDEAFGEATNLFEAT